MRIGRNESEFRVVDKAVSDELAHAPFMQFTNRVLEKLPADSTMPVFGPHLHGEFRGRAPFIDECVRGSDGFAVFNRHEPDHVWVVTNERFYLSFSDATYRVEETQIPIPLAQTYEKLAIEIGVVRDQRADNHAAMLATPAEEPAKSAFGLGRT